MGRPSLLSGGRNSGGNMTPKRRFFTALTAVFILATAIVSARVMLFKAAADVQTIKQRLYWTKITFSQLFEDTTDFDPAKKRNFIVHSYASFSDYYGYPQYAVSKDGKRVVYVKEYNGRPQIYLLDISSGKKLLYDLTQKMGKDFVTININPSISGDGRFVAFISNREGRAPTSVKNVYIIDINKKKICNLSLHNQVNNAAWDTRVMISEDGKRVAWKERMGLAVIDLTNPDEKKEDPKTKKKEEENGDTADFFSDTFIANKILIRAGAVTDFCLAKDGKKIAFIGAHNQNIRNYECFVTTLPALNNKNNLLVQEKYAFNANISNSDFGEFQAELSSNGNVLIYQRDRKDWIEAPVKFRYIKMRAFDIVQQNLDDLSLTTAKLAAFPNYKMFLSPKGTTTIFLSQDQLYWNVYDIKANKVTEWKKARYFKDDPEITEEAKVLAKYDPEQIKQRALLVSRLKSLQFSQDESVVVYEMHTISGNYFTLYMEKFDKAGDKK